jgi:hypothetical protein
MRKLNFLIVAGPAIALLTACNLPATQVESRPWETAAAETIAAMQEASALPSATETSTPPPPTETSIPSVTPTPQDPLVLRDALCWAGPGSIYEVVSALKKDARVDLLGRSTDGAYWVVDNPIYHDPCWVNNDNLLLDSGIQITTLKVFTPPPTYTPIPPTLTSTPTP